MRRPLAGGPETETAQSGSGHRPQACTRRQQRPGLCMQAPCTTASLWASTGKATRDHKTTLCPLEGPTEPEVSISALSRPPGSGRPQPPATSSGGQPAKPSPRGGFSPCCQPGPRGDGPRCSTSASRFRNTDRSDRTVCSPTPVTTTGRSRLGSCRPRDRAQFWEVLWPKGLRPAPGDPTT